MAMESLSLAIGNCRDLRELDLDVILKYPKLGEAILEVKGPQLHSLCIIDSYPKFIWDDLLSNPGTKLDTLQSLWYVPAEYTPTVASLTGLAALSVHGISERKVTDMTLLRNLSNIEVLELYGRDRTRIKLLIIDLSSLIRPMTKLRCLTVKGIRLGDSGTVASQLDALLQERTSVTQVAFNCGVTVPANIDEALGFSRLRGLSASVYGSPYLLCTAALAKWTGLQHLKLELEVDACREFVEHLTDMPRLSTLTLYANGFRDYDPTIL
jgi:hypothetical protein